MKNFQDLLKQAKNLQESMTAAQEALKSKEFLGESGAGLVKIVVSGEYIAKSIEIDESLYNEEKEMLADLIVAAFNDARTKIEAYIKSTMPPVDMPNLFGM